MDEQHRHGVSFVLVMAVLIAVDLTTFGGGYGFGYRFNLVLAFLALIVWTFAHATCRACRKE